MKLLPFACRLACVLLPASATFAAEQVEFIKKVVFTSPGAAYSRLTDSDIAELRKAAPSLKLVFPDREHLMAEAADADALIGQITPDLIRTAKKVQWVQVM